METVSVEEYGRRLAMLCVRSGVVGLPRNERDRRILLHSVIRTLDRDRTYTQKELDEKLKAWLQRVGRRVETDHVSLRRALVDHGFLDRDGYGAAYATRDAADSFFAPEVERIDVVRLIDDEQANIDRRKAEHQP